MTSSKIRTSEFYSVDSYKYGFNQIRKNRGSHHSLIMIKKNYVNIENCFIKNQMDDCEQLLIK